MLRERAEGGVALFGVGSSGRRIRRDIFGGAAFSQAVIDARRPGPGVREGGVNPGQNDMRGDGVDDMGLLVGGRSKPMGQRAVTSQAAQAWAGEPCIGEALQNNPNIHVLKARPYLPIVGPEPEGISLAKNPLAVEKRQQAVPGIHLGSL